MSIDKLCTACSYIFAAAVLGAMVYWLPLLFIGIVAGYLLGKYYDTISSWLEDDHDEDS